jgi:hypothetical protein
MAGDLRRRRMRLLQRRCARDEELAFREPSARASRGLILPFA